ncbi:MAG: hypothetical protein, partial [Olavius algarvensis Gamma 3 endosymbiont]
RIQGPKKASDQGATRRQWLFHWQELQRGAGAF